MFKTEFGKNILEAVIAGVIWAFAFYFIRKGLNKRNFVQDPEKKREGFMWDAIYGGFAAFFSVLAKKYIAKNFLAKN